eukprot:scaffold18569_cov20-Prasinocladus_malaysianus.AAC.1
MIAIATCRHSLKSACEADCTGGVPLSTSAAVALAHSPGHCVTMDLMPSLSGGLSITGGQVAIVFLY